MTCTCLQRFCLKMHIYCSKITTVKLVQIFLQYLNLTKLLPMLNINKHGNRKIKRNVLNTISNVLKNLNIKNLLERMYTNTIGQKRWEVSTTSTSTDLCQQIVSDFVLILLQRYLKRVVVLFVGINSNLWNGRAFWSWKCQFAKVDGVTRKARCKSTDPVRELKGPILTPGCSRVCPYVLNLWTRKNAYSDSCKQSLDGRDSRWITRLDICRTVAYCKGSP